MATPITMKRLSDEGVIFANKYAGSTIFMRGSQANGLSPKPITGIRAGDSYVVHTI